MHRNLQHIALHLLTLGTARGFAVTVMAASPVAHVSPRTGTNSTAAAVRQLRQAGCHVLEVTLHGNASPTAKCSLVVASSSAATPYTLATTCASANDLKIYQDAFQKSTGAVICFSGTGFINMTDYWINWFQSWNDQASSWSSGKWQGAFYKDISGEGVSQNFNWFSTGEFDGQNGALPNDSLSSLKIDGSAPGY